MPHTCPQCHAKYPDDETCVDRFDVSQLKELAEPSYYAVHHLSVPCSMLQHNAYSRPGWLAVRELLDQFLHHGVTPQEMRRRNHKPMDSRNRKWNLTRGPKLPGVEEIVWQCTIADVRLETAEQYIADVRRWAGTILADSEKLVRQAES